MGKGSDKGSQPDTGPGSWKRTTRQIREELEKKGVKFPEEGK